MSRNRLDSYGQTAGGRAYSPSGQTAQSGTGRAYYGQAQGRQGGAAPLGQAYGGQNPYTSEYDQGNPYAEEPYAQDNAADPYAQPHPAPPAAAAAVPVAQGDPYNPPGGRQQRAPNSYESYEARARPQQGYGGGGPKYVGGQDYAGGYEMNELNPRDAAEPGGDDMGSFLSEVEEIRAALAHVDENISRIESLHQRSLNDVSEEQSGQTQRQIDALGAQTSQLMNNLKNRIKTLQSKSRDATRKSQSDNVANKFKTSLQRYQSMEANYRQRYRERMGRQYKIVRPDATDEEVRAAVDDTGGGQIFSQALLQSNRRGEARTALQEVQARHQDIQKIERTMNELAQLFQDMAVIVETQEPVVTQINQASESAKTNLQDGVVQTDKAVKSARAARRKKWICLAIVLLILIIVGVVVGVVVSNQNKKPGP